MAASAQLKTQAHSHPPTKSNRRKRRQITTTSSPTTAPIVTSEGAWCCSAAKPYAATSPSPPHHHRHLPRRGPVNAPNGNPPPPTAPPPPASFSDHMPTETLETHEIVTFHSPSPVRSRGSSGGVSPIMDVAPPPAAAAAFAPYPSSYSKFNTALNAGLLNPLSPPPLDKTRSSPTLLEMMASEQDCHPRNQILLPSLPPLPPPGGRQYQLLQQPQIAVMSVQDRQLLLQERVAEILGGCCPGNHLGDPDSGDVRLTLTSRDGFCVSMGVHRHVLVAHSRFFATKLFDGRSKQQQHRSSLPQHLVEISDCDDVEVYVETLRLMYCGDLRRCLMKEDVTKVLAILKVSAAIAFDAGVLSCLEYLEAAPWAEDEEEKVASLLSQLRLENSSAGEVLKRVFLEVAPSSAEEGNGNNGGEEILVRLLQVVLEGKDEKARREMKGLVSKMLRENNSNNRGGGIGAAAAHDDLRKESLYAACDGCLRLLHHHFLRAAASDLAEVSQIARQADNLHWILDILIDHQVADEFLRTWAAQSEISEMHPRVPAIHRHEVSRITGRLLVGIGKGQILASKEARCLLMETWLEPFYEDFGWMRRACKGLDRHLIEDGLGNTILTLPLGLQQDILLAWFDRFLSSGDDCPNIQRGFEVWWRRAFWRRSGGEADPPRRLRIADADAASSS